MVPLRLMLMQESYVASRLEQKEDGRDQRGVK